MTAPVEVGAAAVPMSASTVPMTAAAMPAATMPAAAVPTTAVIAAAPAIKSRRHDDSTAPTIRDARAVYVTVISVSASTGSQSNSRTRVVGRRGWHCLSRFSEQY
jgi:hypothetical protein